MPLEKVLTKTAGNIAYLDVMRDTHTFPKQQEGSKLGIRCKLNNSFSYKLDEGSRKNPET